MTHQPNHLCCLGFDPRLQDIPVAFQSSGVIKRIITDFFNTLLEACPNIPVIKFNFAYFEQYGLEGMEALRECLVMAKSAGKFIIADVKRGDIDITNQAIIQGLSQAWYADGATFHTYLGIDTFKSLNTSKLRPYFLIRTSNPSGSDIQALTLQKPKSPLFLHVLDYYLGHFPEGGFVMGGTDLKALGECLSFCNKRKATPYLLIPGVGRQGADTARLMELITQYYLQQAAEKVVINVSSGIIYAAAASTRSVKEVFLATQDAARRYTEQLSVKK